MSLLNQVEKSLRWKKNDRYCAIRLGISIEEYQDLKKQVTLKLIQRSVNNTIESEHNLDKGEGKIKVITDKEPKTPEEVEELLKIKGSSIWKLSHYYNKQQANGSWMVTGLISRKQLEPKDLLANTLKNFNPQPIVIHKVEKLSSFDNPVCGVISVQDLHFGKENNEGVVQAFRSSMQELIYKSHLSHNVNELIFVIGGDLLNMDTWSGTTTSGTPVGNGMTAQKAYDLAFDNMHWAITFLSQFCNHLKVVYLPGNHDRLSSYHLAHALSKCFMSNSDIEFDVEYAERKVHTYGDNFFAFEHGDVSSKDSPLVYATEFPKQWGLTKYRVCFTGHWHKKKTVEYVTENETHGFAIKHLPSLCGSDYWHYHKKFTGSKRQAIIELYDRYKGKVSEFNTNH